MAERVILHIGPPKTATTYVQEILWRNRRRLDDQGYTLAAATHRHHIQAMGDLLELPRGPRTEGAWDRQVRRVAASTGTVIISQEQLSRASAETAAKAVAAFRPVAVSVIVTARDPARQLTSYWQQRVKFRHTEGLRETVAAVCDHTDEEFWLQQDIPAVVDRWGAAVGHGQVVVVTLPPPGSPREELWRRFASACGLDPDGFALDAQFSNDSLGAAQTELLRRVNAAMGDRLTTGGAYGLVRRLGANWLLAGQEAYEAIRLGPDALAWAHDLGAAWAAGLADRGVRVAGDLRDLIPTAPGADRASAAPEEPSEATVNAAAVELIIGLLEAGAAGAMRPPRRDGLGFGGALRRDQPATEHPPPRA
jgi:hypothetical protein